MSYILEALKKSDKERRRDEIPGLQADHSLPPSRRRKLNAPFWRFLGAVVFVLSCGGGLLWWQLGADEKVQPVIPAISVAEPVPPLVQEVQVSEKQRPVAHSGGFPSGANTLAGTKVDPVAVPSTKMSSPIPAATVVEKEPVLVESKVVQAPEEYAEFIPPLMEELPVAIRAALPDLAFAGHVYSDVPEKRLIIINNRIVREGDLIVNGLFLKKIDREGVVLLYETSLFRVKLF